MRLNFTLLFFLCLLAFTSSIAQNCDPLSPPNEAAEGCNCAFPDCNVGLNGFSGTLGAPNGNQTGIPECTDGNGGTFHNDDWIAFIAGSTSIDITITPNNCDVVNNLSGVQAGFYGACSDDGDPGTNDEGVPSEGLLVQCGCSVNALTLNYDDFVIGQTYYIFLDGCGGSVCDYFIVVNSGSTMLNPPTPLGTINGPSTVCPGATVTYTVTSDGTTPDFDWQVTGGGVIVSEDGDMVTVTWNSGGTLSTSGFNACFSTNTVDLPVTVQPLPDLFATGTYCSNEPGYVYPPNGQTYTAGSHVITETFTSGPNAGCSQITNLDVSAGQIYNVTVDRAICFGEQVVYGGLPYSNAGMYDIPLTTTNTNCDSIINLNLTVLDPLSVLMLPPAPIDVLTCSNTSVLIDGSQSFPAQDIQTYFWTSPTGDDIPTNGSPLLTVETPGVYCLDVGYSVLDGESNTLTTCTNQSCIEVFQDIEEPNLTTSQTNLSCGGANDGTATVNITGGTAPFLISWTDANNTITETVENLPAGTYTVTVFSLANGCQSFATVTIQEPAPISLDLDSTSPGCSGGTTGTATANPSGGSGIYTYEWNTSPIQVTQTAIGLGGGTYTVIVTDENDCTATDMVTLTDVPALELTTSSEDASCGGNMDGSASVTATGGDMNYTYEWNTSPVQVTPTAVDVAAGSYIVIVTDGNGCSGEATVVVDEPTGVTVTPSSIDVECNGDDTGEASVATSGGTAPFEYTWNTTPIQTTSTATNLTAGTYMVTIEDANDCQVIETITIIEPTALALVESGIDTDCNASSNGEASVSASGGTPGYTYEWNTTPIQTGATATGLAQGTYTVVVTDDNDCTATVSVTINQPTALVLTESGVDVLCNSGQDGEVSVVASGGVGPYEYEWNTTPVQTNATATGLTEGTYTVIVTDDNDCTETVDVTISEPTALVLTPASEDPDCNNSTNGEASIVASGGTGPYTYEWNTTPVQTGAMATGLTGGSYTVIVTDDNDCTASETIVLTAPNALSLSTNQEDVLCNGELTGEATVVATGGTGTLEYLWDDGASQNTPTAVGLGAGTYIVIVTDENDCTETISIILTEPTTALSASGTSTDALCGQTNGTIDLTVMGGTAPYSYDWGAAGTNEDPNNLSAGTYTVIVTDDNDCTTTASVTVDSPDSPAATVSITDVSCNGVADGEMDITVSGGIMPYTFEWDPASNDGNEDLSSSVAGNFSVTVTDDVGCFVIATGVIEQPDELEATATASPADCGIDNGSVSVVVMGGTAPYNFDWPGTANDGEQSPTDLAAGPYEVTITDDNGCIVLASADVIIPNGPTTSLVGTNVDCNGEETGSIALTITGGEAPYDIDWGDPNLDGNTDLSDLPAGDYEVVVTDENNCSSVSIIEIEESEVLALTSSFTDVSCFGGSDGTAEVIVTGGTGPYTYEWCDGQTTAQVNNCVPGPCEVIITDDNGCIITTIIDIGEPTELEVSAVPSAADCNGASTGSIEVTATGGTAPYSYEWTGGIPLDTEDPGTLTAGGYDLVVTDANGCETPVTNIIIDEPTELEASATANETDCGIDNGEISITVTGGTMPYNYDWPGTDNDGDANPTTLAAGTYEITITDDNGCIVLTDAEVTVPDGPTASVDGTNIGCNGEETGTASLTITGGAMPYDIDWGDPNLNGNTELSDLPAGVYEALITDANNCTSSTFITLTEPEALSITTDATAVSCFAAIDGIGEVTVTGGTGPYTYEWCDGQTTALANGLPSGTCTVVVMDDNGCTISGSVEIDQPTELEVSAVPSDADCNAASTGSIEVTATGGTGAYSYDWTGGVPADTEDPGSLAAGTYEVTITDENGCSMIIPGIEINEPEALAVSFATTDATCNESNGTIDLTITGGTLPYTYDWTGGLIGEDPMAVATGSYDVIVTDGNGCTIAETVLVNTPSALGIFSTFNDADCNGASTGTIDITVTGGTQPFTYQWDDVDLQETEDAIDLPAGTYTVIVTDDNGCTIETSATIAEPTAMVLSATSVDATCNTSNGSIDLTVSGGTSPYVFDWSGSAMDIEDPQNLSSGNYNVTVTDDNGCTSVLNQSVDTPSGLGGSTTTVAVNCFGESNGSIDLTVVGGNSPYTYLWDDANAQIIEDPIDLPAGDYEVVVTDGDGCTIVASATIIQPELLEASGSSSDASCNQANGSIDLTVNGGIEPYTYDWSGTAADIEDPTDLLSGNYDVIVTDANGCTATTSVMVTEPDALALASTPSDALCNGEASGSIDLTVTGGTGAGTYTYQWNDAGAQIIEDPIDLEAGMYNVVVTDGNGCTITTDVTIGEPIALNSSATTVNEICGESNGSIDITVTGGTLPYTYDWSDPAPDMEDPTGLQAGVYNVTVTDGNGCTYTTSVTVNTPNQLLATPTPSDALCNGEASGSIDLEITGGSAPYTVDWGSLGTDEDPQNVPAGDYTGVVTDNDGCEIIVAVSIGEPTAITASFTAEEATCNEANGSIDLSVNGGTGPYSYQWDGGADPVEDPANLSAGVYNVTITDANSCTLVYSTDVSTPTALALSTTSEDALCNGDNNGSIDLSVSGGTAPFSYDWGAAGSTEDLSNLPAGVYDVIVTDGEGCTITASVTIGEPEVLVAVNNSATNVSCNGGNDGSALIVTTGGTAPYTYDWSDNTYDGQEAPNNMSSGSYTVTVTDENGCTTTESVLIEEPEALLLSASSVPTLCFGSSDGSIELNVQGGNGPYVYNWNNGTYVVEDPTGVTAGNFTVVVTDANGCTETTSVQVSQPNALLVNIDNVSNYGGANVTCSDATDGSAEALGVGGTGPYSYEWSTGTTGPMVEDLGVGTYEVIVTDGNGCTSVNEVLITGPAAVSLSTEIIDPLCYGENDGVIMVDGAGGTAPYSYSIDGADFTTVNQFVGLESGIYDIVVQDNNGCEQELEAIVNDPAELILDLGEDLEIQLGDSIDLSPLLNLPVSALDTFYWADASLVDYEPSVKPLNVTNYLLTVIDEDGCIDVDEVQVRVRKDRLIYIPNIFTPNGDGLNDILMINGGTGVKEVKTFRMFNRWGEVLHEAYNFQPNSPEYGWDGMFRGEMMNPQVFVYFAEVEFVDGRIELYKGDVTLMR